MKPSGSPIARTHDHSVQRHPAAGFLKAGIIRAWLGLLCVIAVTASVQMTFSKHAAAQATGLNYTTWKGNNGRTGQQLKETILTPSNVNSAHFGILFSRPVDGKVLAQPLYLSHVSIAGGTHNVVFVATEHDSVYAFDADKSRSPLWHRSLIPPGATTVPNTHAGLHELGITGTPVIDASAGTLYVVAETLQSGQVVFRLHALKVASGQEEGGSPVVIKPSGFQPKQQMQRPGLLLASGNVYAAFGSTGDDTPPYHGWIIAFSATSLAQVGVWNSTPTGNEGAVWMSGSGLAASSSGHVYAITGNGSWNGTSNFSDSFVRLSPNLTLVDYFTPFNQAELSAQDLDVGAGGLLLVDSHTAFPDEAIGCGKFPAIYVVDRVNMGKFHSGSNNQIIQEVDNQVGGGGSRQPNAHCFMTPAFWNQRLYFAGNNDVLKAFSFNLSTGKMSARPISKGSFVFAFPGAQPVVSANGTSNGIVWVVDNSPSISLHAYDATNLTRELFRSSGLGTGDHFAVPTVVNGKVYVGTASTLFVLASH